MSEESLRNQLKELFTKHGIDDSNFALISVAVSGNGVETEAKNSTTYIGKIVWNRRKQKKKCITTTLLR